MRVIRSIVTPWTPYALTFSPDGIRLAIGGATWYGGGGILLVDLRDGGLTEMTECANLAGPVVTYRVRSREWPWEAKAGTASGLAFSSEHRYLAVATRGSERRFGPSFLLNVERVPADVVTVLAPDIIEGTELFAPATGMLLLEDRLLLRRETDNAGGVCVIWNLPMGVRVQTSVTGQNLAHRGVIIVRDTAITGDFNDRSHMTYRGEEFSPLFNRVIMKSLGAGSDTTTLRGASTHPITAINRVPSTDCFITGTRAGELDRWNWDGRTWFPAALQERTACERPEGDAVWLNYTPSSVVGICHLHDGTRWVSINAGGEVSLRAGAKLEVTWRVPVPGSPRSLAGHPAHDLVAIGVKQGGWRKPPSVVLLVAID